jgi:hypothetical protein
MSYFSNLGRRIPETGMRVFNQTPSEYYRLNQPNLAYSEILGRLKKHDLAPMELSNKNFENTAQSLLNVIELSNDFRHLLNGVHVPFVYADKHTLSDLGNHLEDHLLPSVQKSFNEVFPQSHFKAVLQSNSELKGNIKIASHSGYESLVDATQQGPVVGWYFPQALQEFDVESQRLQMKSLPQLENAQVCLSGAIDICAAVVGSPHLLMSEDFYTPIVCMSALQHVDPRMVLLLKAYGPHLEFWCMTQMLTKDLTQVSEQWSGGLCIFSNLSDSQESEST